MRPRRRPGLANLCRGSLALNALVAYCLVYCISPVSSGLWSGGDKSSSSLSSSVTPTASLAPTQTHKNKNSNHNGNSRYGVEVVELDMDSNNESSLQASKRSIDQWNLSDFLLIGTIDGTLQARDRKTGLEMWSIPGDSSMVKVNTLEQVHQMAQRGGDDDADDSGSFTNDVNIIWIVEPLGDGGLYYFLPSIGLQKLPVSIKQLVLESPFLINGDDKVYTGSRTTTLFSIDARTGEIIKVYGTGNKEALGRAECSSVYADLSSEMLDCDADSGPESGVDYDDDANINDGSHIHTTRRLNHDGIFMIGRTDYHLEIHNKSEIIWNVTFSTWGPNNMDLDLLSQHRKSPDNLYVTPLHENSILALSANSTGKPAMWAGDVPSIAVHIFDVFQSPKNYNNHLVLLPQPHYPLESASTDIGTYIDRTADGHWFALSGANFPSLVRRAPTAKWHAGLHVSNRADLYNSIIGVHSNYNAPVHLIDMNNGRASTIQDSYVPALPLPTSENGLSYDNGQSRHHSQNNQVGHYYGDNRGVYYGEGPRRSGNRPMLPPPVDGLMDSSLDSYSNSGWQLLSRIVENVLTVLLVVLLGFIGAKLGLLPHLVYFLESMLLVLNGKGQQPPVSTTEIATSNSEKYGEKQQMKQQPDSVQSSSDSSVSDNVIATTATSTDDILETEKQLKTTKTKSVSIADPQVGTDLADMSNANVNNIDGQTTGSTRRRKRGSRGGKRSAAKRRAALTAAETIQENDGNEGPRDQTPDAGDSESDFATNEPDSTSDHATSSTIPGLSTGEGVANPITVLNNEEPIGLGSHGTVVFNGTFQNREVAVKRMVLNFYDIASQEISLLQESDDHPNVVRYYCSHQTDQFLYIALEKCPGTLEHVFTEPQRFDGAVERMNPVNILHQIASGILHLHSLKIVHRDIKPQNILVAPPKKLHKKGPNNQNMLVYGPPRVLISDFGLCKRLEGDQSSFRPTTAQPAGTAGWTAPEISMGSRFPVTEPNASSSDLLIRHDELSANRRLTRAVDIFSLGCVFYYVLSKGQHPFGPQKKREVNIEENNYDLSDLDDDNDPDNSLAKDLVSRMISFNPKDRPTAAEVLLHPLFWPAQKKLDLLIKFSDRFEKKLATSEEDIHLISLFEKQAPYVIGNDWSIKLDKAINDDLTRFRRYHEDRLLDLIRAMRNKVHHFNELTDYLKSRLGPLPDGFLTYFGRKFPLLILTVYYFTKEYLSQEETFKSFFEQSD